MGENNFYGSDHLELITGLLFYVGGKYNAMEHDICIFSFFYMVETDTKNQASATLQLLKMILSFAEFFL